ncbi:MAG: transposase, partial [Dokdonella sp.]
MQRIDTLRIAQSFNHVCTAEACSRMNGRAGKSSRMLNPLAEFGVFVAHSDLALRRVLADLGARALPARFRVLLNDLAAYWAQVRARIDACDARIELQARGDERCVRISAITGSGSITAGAAVATAGNAREFRHGRQMSAWLGL